MPTLHFEHHLTADPANAWRVVSDLSRWAQFDPTLASAQVLGTAPQEQVLRGVTHGGRAVQERCVDYRAGESLTLEVEGAQLPFPLATRRRQVAVAPADGGVTLSLTLTWTTQFGPLGALLAGRRRLGVEARQTLEAMIHAVREQQWAHKSTVQSILNHKGNAIVSVAPEARVSEAASLLRANRIGTVLVIDPDDRLVGLVSERDIAYELGERGAALLDAPVREIMSTNLVVCAPDHDMEFVMVCMTDKRVRHLPVMDGDRLVGIISIGDVVRERIARLEAESQTMREYIQAREWRYLQHGGSDPDLMSSG